ncbi:glycosyltransferase family 2 protein [Flavobacterium sp. xlx-214]|uniref:glycosyltransferase family 2 protein n=1 Tax=unclassified Flavobacterium TaxID=196869 RepID=UPI0013D3B689|nr:MULTISPECIES: glycosyltransferase family 2 protein [unclassified Flavobacterium]MBA5792851.1 glycosyltransferase family 2 protein [Flavobacterium sp. xlx-221]QMI83985.1 glycosyltransferase family 2 protein [Flavobacterium sp. xlx-214]
MKQLTLIIPVYNEELSIPVFVKEFREFYSELQVKGYATELLFVDDGSKDNTCHVLTKLAQENDDISVLIFSRNFGKEAALFAGLENAKGSIVIPMDVDLQDPFDMIPLMIDEYEKGADVVLARRINRSNDRFLKRFSAQWFYRLNNKMSSLKLEENVGDFRLMTQQVVNEIISLQENQLFMKGLMSWVGFNTAIVDYVRPNRKEGKTKFNYRKLWNLAVQGITSFSTLPLKVWTYFGSIIAFISFLYGLKIIVEKLFFGINASGYASLMVAILFFGGVQLIGIGVLGEYLGRTYLESKRRPKYIIKNKI